jgi:SAM-dependent methyltransferase
MAALANWLWCWLVGGDVSPERFRWQAPEEKRVLLHVGCGRANRSHLPCAFQAPEWHEVRVDLDREVEPDLVASVTDLSAVPDGAADAYYASHVIEHLYWFEVPQALAEARRVLKPNGFAVITCPDLQEAAAMIAEDRLYDVAYYSPAGPITPFDIVFSYRVCGTVAADDEPQVRFYPDHAGCGASRSGFCRLLRDASSTGV